MIAYIDMFRDRFGVEPICRVLGATERGFITSRGYRAEIVTWIERTYHRRRRQARLGRLTPVEFETMMNKPVALAA